MKISRHKAFNQTVLFDKLKNVTLMNNPEVLIYKEARLSVESVSPAELFPAQYYVLETELEKIRAIKEGLLEKGVDIFRLTGYVKYWLETDPSTPIDILPPVVEASRNRDGEKVPLICDGMHRIYSAKKLGIPINVIYIQNIPEEKYPYYAWPNPDGWTQVVEIDGLTEDYRKKAYRWEPPLHKQLFRDFNTAFDNVGRIRPKSEREQQR
jgi:hypothetical protein